MDFTYGTGVIYQPDDYGEFMRLYSLSVGLHL